jgi:hypothetical protein
MSTDTLLRILHIVEDNRRVIRDVKAELEILKQAMQRNVGDATDIDADLNELFLQPFDTETELEQFCQMLQDDRVLRKKVVSF